MEHGNQAYLCNCNPAPKSPCCQSLQVPNAFTPWPTSGVGERRAPLVDPPLCVSPGRLCPRVMRLTLSVDPSLLFSLSRNQNPVTFSSRMSEDVGVDEQNLTWQRGTCLRSWLLSQLDFNSGEEKAIPLMSPVVHAPALKECRPIGVNRARAPWGPGMFNRQMPSAGWSHTPPALDYKGARESRAPSHLGLHSDSPTLTVWGMGTLLSHFYFHRHLSKPS